MDKRKRVLVDVAEIGRKGGNARAESMSQEQLSEIGKHGAASRWANTTPEERAAHGAMLAAARAKARRKAGAEKGKTK
jgi:general stress protein YciG